MDFAVGVVNSVLNLLEGNVKFFGEFKLQKNCNQCCSSPIFFVFLEMTFGLVHVSHSLPEWQAVKLTFYTLMVHYRGDKHGLEKTSFINFRLIFQYSEIVAKLL